jgi:hypothetical protein
MLKMVDKQGRLLLGKKYANQPVEVDEFADTVQVSLVDIIPKRERWLREHPKAAKDLEESIAEARAGNVAARDLDEALGLL